MSVSARPTDGTAMPEWTRRGAVDFAVGCYEAATLRRDKLLGSIALLACTVIATTARPETHETSVICHSHFESSFIPVRTTR